MATSDVPSLIDSLKGLHLDLHQSDFLLTWDHSAEELEAVLTVAEVLEQLYRGNISTRVFDAGLAVSIFRDQSTRTRFSFAGAA